MDLEFLKCVVTNFPNKSKLQPIAFTTYLKAQNVNHKITPHIIPKRTIYLPSITPSLITQIEHPKRDHRKNKIQSIANLLSPTSLQHKIKILNIVIYLSIEYAFLCSPLLILILSQTKQPTKRTKSICKTPEVLHTYSHNSLVKHSTQKLTLLPRYITTLSEQLTQAL